MISKNIQYVSGGKRKKYSLEERNVFLKLVITIPTLKKKGTRENIILSPM
jgi:hypothetical protein